MSNGCNQLKVINTMKENHYVTWCNIMVCYLSTCCNQLKVIDIGSYRFGLSGQYSEMQRVVLRRLRVQCSRWRRLVFFSRASTLSVVWWCRRLSTAFQTSTRSTSWHVSWWSVGVSPASSSPSSTWGGGRATARTRSLSIATTAGRTSTHAGRWRPPRESVSLHLPRLLPQRCLASCCSTPPGTFLSRQHSSADAPYSYSNSVRPSDDRSGIIRVYQNRLKYHHSFFSIW